MVYVLMSRAKNSYGKWHLFSNVGRKTLKESERMRKIQEAKYPNVDIRSMKIDLRKQSAREEFPNLELV